MSWARWNVEKRISISLHSRKGCSLEADVAASVAAVGDSMDSAYFAVAPS